jgi:hypothetical protein
MHTKYKLLEGILIFLFEACVKRIDAFGDVGIRDILQNERHKYFAVRED